MAAHVKMVAYMLDELQESEERSAMMRQLIEDGIEGAGAFENDFKEWIDDARNVSSRAANCHDCAMELTRRVGALTKQSQRLATACSYIILGDGSDGAGALQDSESFWWYKHELASNDGSVDYVQAHILQMMHFFGITDFFRDLICLAVLDPFSEMASSDAARYEPFHTVALAKSYDLIAALDVTLGGSLTPFMQFCGAWGFASKILPDTVELQEGFKYGYGDFGEEVANPDVGTLLHVLVESDAGRRSPNRSWEVCTAVAVVLKLGGSLQALNGDNQTAMSLASTTDGIVFGYFVRASLGSTRVAWAQEGRGATSTGGEVGESKEAATKAEVQALRDELRDTKRQLGNILLLFGKLLGLQHQNERPTLQETREESKESIIASDNDSANSSGSDVDGGDREDSIAII